MFSLYRLPILVCMKKIGLALASICQAFLVLLCRSLPSIVYISITATVCTFVCKEGGICIYFFLYSVDNAKHHSGMSLDSCNDFGLYLFISHKELAGKYCQLQPRFTSCQHLTPAITKEFKCYYLWVTL